TPRFPNAPPPPARAPGRVSAARLETRRRVSDEEPDPSGALRGDAPRRGRRQPPAPPGRRDDETGRPRSLHTGPLLPDRPSSLSERHRPPLATPPCDEDGRTPGSTLARHHPKELRLLPIHRRARARGSRAGLQRG